MAHSDLVVRFEDAKMALARHAVLLAIGSPAAPPLAMHVLAVPTPTMGVLPAHPALHLRAPPIFAAVDH